MVEAKQNSMNSKSAQTAFAESNKSEISLLNRANVFESCLNSWGVPRQIAEEVIKHHIKVNYDDGQLIFNQGSAADNVMWVVKGVVREICPNPKGTQTLVRLATPGDILGLADKLNERGDWVRRFEAWSAGRCVLAMVTRDKLRNLMRSMPPHELLAVAERMNSASSDWLEHYATFLGLSFRERLEITLAELGRKLGVPDKDGILIAFEPTHSDLAEIIGSSRPVIGRLMSELIADGAIARRERKYILVRGGSIEARLNQIPRPACPDVSSRVSSPTMNLRTIPFRPQHKWVR
jgi:CRP-like cAMP-binding protein